MKYRNKMITGIVGIGVALFLGAFLFIKKNLGYAEKDGTIVYQYIMGGTLKKVDRNLVDVDPETFKSFGFSGIFGKDKNHVYLEGYKIMEADPETFKILESAYKYARDANHLYYRLRKISNNPDGFEYLENGYAKDDSHVFNQGKIVEGADALSFEFMDGEGLWAKDDQHVFYNSDLVEGADSKSFGRIEFNYYQDDRNIFHRFKKMPEAKRATFKVIADRYAKDENSVYYENKIIQGADPRTFEIVPSDGVGYYAKDKDRKYSYGKEIDNFPERIKS